MKVLITSQKGKEKLVEAFKKAGAEVVTKLDSSVKLIVPTVDEELPFFASNREWFRQQGIEVNISSPFTIDTCRDKAEFNLFCGRHSFQTPKTYQPGEIVIKPRFGKGSKGILEVNSSYIIQTSYKDFPEYTIDYYRDSKILSIVPRERVKVVNGESVEGRIYENENIIYDCARLGRELCLEGHNTIQGFLVGKSFLFTEVNSRFGGGFWITQEKYPTIKWLLESVRESSSNHPGASNLNQTSR